jgi:hypothetical protein
VARLQLVAGYDGTNGAMNFNGGSHGRQRIVVPLGWRVDVTFLNKDGDMTHSAVVMPDVKPMPLEVPPPAFARASTTKLEEGFEEGGSDEMSFVADRAGDYIISCGVPGHGQGGEWIRFRVSKAAAAPSYRL